MNIGDNCNVSHISIDFHSGTHVDAPHHFLHDNRTLRKLNLNFLMVPAFMIEIPGEVSEISSENLVGASIPGGEERTLIKNRNSAIWSQGNKEFVENFLAINND